MNTILPLLVIGSLLASSGAALVLGRPRPHLAVRIARGTVLAALAASIGLAIGSTESGGTSLFTGDRLGTTLAVFVAAMGAVVGSFADRSLAADPRAPRFFAAGNALLASTIALALANRPWLMAVAWVAVSVSTVALIGFDGRTGSRAAARRAAMTFVVGDVAVIAAMVAATASAGGAAPAVRDVAMAVGDGSTALILAIGAALLVGAFVRSAQLPFQGWLPASVEAPTPVSAMLHAGVVNGSAILLLRWHPVLSATFVLAAIAVGVGVAGVIVGMAVARTRPDVKGGLAWTTIAQMGFMTVQCSLGLAGPALVHLMAHGMFKSSLFLGAGSGLDRRGSHHHPRHLQPGASDLALAAVVGAGVVAVGLAIVRPHVLTHPAVILPVGFAWATVSYALGQWWARIPARTVFSVAAPAIALSAAFTAAAALASVLDDWTVGLGADQAPPAAGFLAGLALAGVAGVWLAGVVVPLLRPGLASATWMRVSAWATPTPRSIRFALDHPTEDLR